MQVSTAVFICLSFLKHCSAPVLYLKTLLQVILFYYFSEQTFERFAGSAHMSARGGRRGSHFRQQKLPVIRE